MIDQLYERDQLMAMDVSPQEQEYLVRLMEECGELTQACAKTLRWGWISVNPKLPKSQQITNFTHVRCELTDILKLAEKLDLLPLRD